MLAISIRENDNIQGIIVDGTEIKLELFADDLTAFLRNDKFLRVFLGNCTGLTINFDETEILVLGNSAVVPMQDRSTRNIKIKEAVKILGVYFICNHPLRKKLNFIEIIDAIKTKLQFWKWRNLTIIGRIQIVKSFVIPMFMHRAGSICIDKEVISEANKIIFNFIWKGNDKVKPTSLIGDTVDGGLKAPHLESLST